CSCSSRSTNANEKKQSAPEKKQSAPRKKSDADKKKSNADEKKQSAPRKKSDVATEEKSRKTTLPEFFDACHTYLYSGLAVQPDRTLSTQGDPANAYNKTRCGKISPRSRRPFGVPLWAQILYWNDISLR
ncbi:hypothetical protein K432DRAFT_412578, partial [Lepidopterella palustris CBS 459.81]